MHLGIGEGRDSGAIEWNLENDAKSWLAIMAEILPQEDIARVAITLWAIWFAWRKAIHEDVYQSLMPTHNFVDGLMLELGEGKQVQRPQTRVYQSRPTWIALPLGVVNINVDAALSKNTSTASEAAIARYQDG